MAPDARDEHAAWIRTALDRFEVPLVAYARRIGGDLHAARDVVQEAFLRLCREDRARVEARLAPWLYTVCRRLAIDERRRGRRTVAADGATLDAHERASPPAEAADASAERREAAASALDAIAALPERQQEVLLLKFRHGLSYREISDVTGLGASHVGVLIHDGMTTLRSRFRGAETAESARAARHGGAR